MKSRLITLLGDKYPKILVYPTLRIKLNYVGLRRRINKRKRRFLERQQILISFCSLPEKEHELSKVTQTNQNTNLKITPFPCNKGLSSVNIYFHSISERE